VAENPEVSIEEVEGAEALEFPPMDNDAAVRLGEIAVHTIRERGANLAVDIYLGDDLVYRAKNGTTGPGNDPWLSKKRAVVLFFGTSSYLAKRRLQAEGKGLADVEGTDPDGMALSGGSFPIRVGGEIVGTITMSGEPDVVDHLTVVTAVERFLAG
jgi:uncharacterized protein (UPF0303 family)